MSNFIRKYEEKIIGVMNGFDRLVLRGRIMSLATVGGMMSHLSRASVLLKDFADHAESMTAMLKQASYEEARRLGRQIRYIESSAVRKEEEARGIMEAEGISEGLICTLTCVEPCQAVQIVKNRESKRLELAMRMRKCLHIYHYWIDPVFGFMSARIQTWFPFTIHVCLNGREWLARRMAEKRMRFERRDNCFTRIANVAAAQGLMDGMLDISWPCAMEKVVQRVNPAHGEMFGKQHGRYYWYAHQSEWATDVMFRDREALAGMYPQLVSGGIATFSSEDVMRFLGRIPRGKFKGEVISHWRQRPEGVRLKHVMNGNSVKVYDKQGSVLRVETTINNPYVFKAYRTREGDSGGSKRWRVMRKAVADLHRRAQVSQACNERYLDALSCIDADTPVRALVEPVCQPVKMKGRRVRALHPWAGEDRLLLQTVARGEFSINGFRNSDLLPILHSTDGLSHDEKRRLSAGITRQLRLLRAHGLIKKVPRTYRYTLTFKGRRIITAILQYQNLSLQQLHREAA